MTSRELLTLMRHLSDRGAYKTFLREGDWPEDVQILTEIHKELALYRAAKYVGGPNEYMPKVFMSLREQRELAEKAERRESELKQSEDDLFNALGFS